MRPIIPNPAEGVRVALQAIRTNQLRSALPILGAVIGLATAQAETFELTQESIAKIRGVRRSSVTDIASNIQKQGILTYSRGNIRILDTDALERLSCDCYRIIRDR